MKIVKWDVEEVVALIDLYQHVKGMPNNYRDIQLSELSLILNKRAEMLGIDHDEKFRNMNGMQLMYKKILFIATDGKEGIEPTNKSFSIIYNMYLKAPDAFELILNEFKSRY